MTSARDDSVLVRDPGQLSSQEFDILVVGGGVNGASCALEAAMRGFSVALIERRDFGAQTSSNSARTVHSGLRYLQTLDISRVRSSAHERRLLTRNAPHLITNVPVLLPVKGHGIQGRESMTVYGKIFDFLSRSERNASDICQVVGRTRMLSAAEARSIWPMLDQDPALSGALSWPEGLIFDTERLLIAILRRAAMAGMVAANRIEATRLALIDGDVVGVEARDRIAGTRMLIRAKQVINATGPWIDGLLESGSHSLAQPLALVFAVAVPSIGCSHAIAFEAPDSFSLGGKYHFATPWRGKTILGSVHLPHTTGAALAAPDPEIVSEYVAQAGEVLTGVPILMDHGCRLFWGYLPVDREGQTCLSSRDVVCVHSESNGPRGLISIVGVKYTTARQLAERVLDLVVSNVAFSRRPVSSKGVAYWGGDFGDFEALVSEARQETKGILNSDELRDLVHSYGTGFREVLSFLNPEEKISGSSILSARVKHAISCEMVCTLSDLVFRRTGIGTLERPSRETLEDLVKIAGDSGLPINDCVGNEIDAILNETSYL